ncbi:MAG: hypothetical protein KN64_02150 [Sulfurovum sp. AS07-7]|nr:MAG: hypothetical protein KN64_02150 [Sulfurovum sp. AS07-7]
MIPIFESYSTPNDWTLKILDIATILNLYKIDELGKNGTYVLWENTDRIGDNAVKLKFEDEIYSKVDIVKKHLEFVFLGYLNLNYG